MVVVLGLVLGLYWRHRRRTAGQYIARDAESAGSARGTATLLDTPVVGGMAGRAPSGAGGGGGWIRRLATPLLSLFSPMPASGTSSAGLGLGPGPNNASGGVEMVGGRAGREASSSSPQWWKSGPSGLVSVLGSVLAKEGWNVLAGSSVAGSKASWRADHAPGGRVGPGAPEVAAPARAADIESGTAAAQPGGATAAHQTTQQVRFPAAAPRVSGGAPRGIFHPGEAGQQPGMPTPLVPPFRSKLQAPAAVQLVAAEAFGKEATFGPVCAPAPAGAISPPVARVAELAGWTCAAPGGPATVVASSLLAGDLAVLAPGLLEAWEEGQGQDQQEGMAAGEEDLPLGKPIRWGTPILVMSDVDVVPGVMSVCLRQPHL